jgi:hypothetical protein
MNVAYSSFLASRGYVRVTVERTTKQPGDLVLGANGVLEKVPDDQPTVVAIRGKRARGASS